MKTITFLISALLFFVDPAVAFSENIYEFATSNTINKHTTVNRYTTIDKRNVSPMTYVEHEINNVHDYELKGGLEFPGLIKFSDKVSLKLWGDKNFYHTNSKEGYEAGLRLVVDWSILDLTK